MAVRFNLIAQAVSAWLAGIVVVMASGALVGAVAGLVFMLVGNGWSALGYGAALGAGLPFMLMYGGVAIPYGSVYRGLRHWSNSRGAGGEPGPT